VTWRGLAGTRRLICDWSYLVVFSRQDPLRLEGGRKLARWQRHLISLCPWGRGGSEENAIDRDAMQVVDCTDSSMWYVPLCVAVCCSVLQCVPVRCSVLTRVWDTYLYEYLNPQLYPNKDRKWSVHRVQQSNITSPTGTNLTGKMRADSRGTLALQGCFVVCNSSTWGWFGILDYTHKKDCGLFMSRLKIVLGSGFTLKDCKRVMEQKKCLLLSRSTYENGSCLRIEREARKIAESTPYTPCVLLSFSWPWLEYEIHTFMNTWILSFIITNTASWAQQSSSTSPTRANSTRTVKIEGWL